jgi:ferredoxin-NADP reductase
MLHAETSNNLSSRRIHLIWGVRSHSDAIYHEEINQIVRVLPHVMYQLHEGKLSYDGLLGYVGVDILASSTVFLCGPVPMMHALTKQFLANGKPPQQIVSEEFALR